MPFFMENQRYLQFMLLSQLSRKWLEDKPTAKSLKLSDAITLNIMVKFANDELQTCRVPTSKPGPIFGTKIQQVLK